MALSEQQPGQHIALLLLMTPVDATAADIEGGPESALR